MPLRELEIREALELRVLVGRDVDALAVGAEAGAAVRDGLAALRRDERLLARGHVDQPDVALVDRDELEDGELLVVGRPVGRRPAAALHLEQQPRRGGVLRVHHVDVAVGAVAARRAEGQAVALVRPGAELVLRAAAARQHADLAGREVEAVDLRELVAALVLREDDVVGRAARPARVADAVREERELPAGAEREAHLVDLRRVAEAGLDQHLPLRRVPGGERGRAELGVAAHRLGDGRGDLGQPVRDQVVARLDHRRLGGRRRRRRGLCADARRACDQSEAERRCEQPGARCSVRSPALTMARALRSARRRP